MSDFNARSFSNTAWAFATVRQSVEKLFSALARTAERRVSDFNAQELVNTLWTFATAGQSDGKLFTVFTNAAKHRASEFNAQGVANAAWAFAMACQSDGKFFEVSYVVQLQRLVRGQEHFAKLFRPDIKDEIDIMDGRRYFR